MTITPFSSEECLRLAQTYCDINDMPVDVTALSQVIEMMRDEHYHTFYAWNTHETVYRSLWELIHGDIDQETFFCRGDISGGDHVKSQRPYFDAIDVIMSVKESHVLYCIDKAVQKAYVHVHGDDAWQMFQKNLAEISSAVTVV